MILRPLYMDFSLTDTSIAGLIQSNSNATTQQYMFGPRLLIIPVTTPGVEEWEVYLPKTGEGEGEEVWTYWWTNETFAGGQMVVVPAPLEWIPVFYLGEREEIWSGEVF